VKVTDEIKFEHDRVIKRSRVWLDECVGNETCWVREKQSRSVTKGVSHGGTGASR